MEYLKLILLSFLVSVLSINNLEAQLLKKLKKRVKEATEDVIAEKAAEKAAQESGKVLDSLLDIDPDYESNYQKQLEQMMAAGNEDIDIEESYDFNTKILYEMTINEDNKETVVDYEMLFQKNAPYMATRVVQNKDGDTRDMPSSILSILDDKNEAMIILIEDQKMAQLISMNKIKAIAVEENEAEGIETTFPEIKKTGKTKKILGHNCSEYMSQSASVKYSFWITKELELFQKNMFFNLSKSLGGNSFEHIPEEAQGLMMEMTFEHLDKNEKGRMKVQDIQSIGKTISMKDYQTLNLGGFMQK